MTSALSSARHVVNADPVAFSQLALERGWGDGLPLIPPTAERVAAALDTVGRHFHC
jgi:hypothetical protein